MLGDYMNYNARPAERTAAEKETRKSASNAKELKMIQGFSELEDELSDVDGYDPYDHPIDRRFLE